MPATDPAPERPPAFVAAIERVSAAAGVAAALAMLALFALMLSEVAARNLFGQSLHVTWELAGYAMGAVFFLGAAATMKAGEHVRVGILLELLPERPARLLDLAATLFGLAIALYLTYVVAGLALRSLAGDVRSWSGFRIALWIPQALLVLGTLLLSLQLLARAARLVLGLPADEKRMDPVAE